MYAVERRMFLQGNTKSLFGGKIPFLHIERKNIENFVIFSENMLDFL